MKAFARKVILLLLLALWVSGCSLTRSEGTKIRIRIPDAQRSASSIQSSSTGSLFDSSGHARSEIDVSLAPTAACYFVGVDGSGVTPSYQASGLRGIASSCSTISEMGQLSNFVSYQQLQNEGVRLSMSLGLRNFSLYIVNMKGYDNSTGCPVTNLPDALQKDPLLTIFRYAKASVVVERNTSEISLSAISDTTLTSILPATCYSGIPDAPLNVSAKGVSITGIDVSWENENKNVSGFFIERSLDGFS